MQTKIENEREFAEVIDQLGRAQDEIERKKSESDVLKQMLEAYAAKVGILEYETESYILKRVRDKPALRRNSGVKDSDVVATLRRSEIGKAYLMMTYDSTALKRDFAGNAEGRDQLDAFGLCVTKPVLHVRVEPAG